MRYFVVWALRLLAMTGVLAGSAAAHEVRPAVGDFYRSGNNLRLDIQINLEAILAGIDLDGLINTDEAAGVADYDSARALSADDLAERARATFPGIAENLSLKVNDADVNFAIESVIVAEAQNIAIARDSTLSLSAPLPAGSALIKIGWPRGYGTLILRQQGVEDGFTGYLQGGQSSGPIPIEGHAQQSWGSVFLDYIPVGFDHILPKGLDHILFVLGLFFLSLHLRPLIIQISLFTLAHTVTLALGALNIVQIPGSIVEPLIALSIVYVAVENIFTEGLNRWRPVIIFGFGLLHGLGFASVLGEFGLPAGQFVAALLGFNVGVEFGQLAVIALAFLAVGLWFGKRSWYRPYIAIPASALIALVGAYWFVERVLGVLAA